jgi:predicted AlkP superfamily pyrophosphatase or phosphodiesterase
MHRFLIRLSLTLCFIATAYVPNAFAQKQVIVVVWDGLRPDAVDKNHTPNLYRFMKNGVQFADHHSTFPTLTMMNAASFATGDRAGKTGFFGNMLWAPDVAKNNSQNEGIDFRQPVFAENYQILKGLNTQKLLYANTLFNVAHEKGIATASFGKSGPAFRGRHYT